MANKFYVSVANAIGRHPVTKEAIFFGKTNVSSAFTLSMQATDIRAGINNALVYKYMNTRDLTVSITQATASESFLALNTGNDVTIGAGIKILKTECVQLDATGNAILSETAVGNVSVFLADNTIQIVTPTAGTEISVVGYADQKADAVYEYIGDAKLLTVTTDTPPTIIDLTLIGEVRDNQRGLVEYIHINVPSFQVDGNYELSFSADGVSQESLNGSAVKVDGERCVDGDIYAYVKWIPVADTSQLKVKDIVVLPSGATMAVAETLELEVKGLYSGSYAPLNIALADCTYASSDEAVATVTNGVITAVGAGATTITVTYVVDAVQIKDYALITVA